MTAEPHHSSAARPPRLRVLLVHNRYLQAGGEDTVVAAEKELLESQGHDVSLFEDTNLDLSTASTWKKTAAAMNAVYSIGSKRRVGDAIRQFGPDVVHIHNFFNRLSPSVYGACHDAELPVVQTLHNFRLLCLNAFLYRDGHTCEDCLGRFIPWPGVRHACYRDDRAASATVAAMLTIHRAMDTWARRVTRYIALTQFARTKFIAAGLPSDQILVKPNLVYPTPDPGRGDGDYALFVGRLSPEKGIDTLLAAWEQLGDRLPLQIVGDGPLAPAVREAARARPGITYRGRLPRPEALELMKTARVMIFPSVWYEMFSMTAVEALSVGLPVIASKLGSITELIQHQQNGLLFEPANPAGLVAQVDWALAHPDELAAMRGRARRDFEEKYIAEKNYEMLIDIYRQAIDHHRSGQ